MEQDHWEKDREPVEAREEQAPEQAVEKWATKDWDRVENAYAPNAAPRHLTKKGRPVFSKSAPNAVLP
jgi:hypothetical protein